MMFGGLDVLNAFSVYDIFKLTVGSLGYNSIVSLGASVVLRDVTG